MKLMYQAIVQYMAIPLIAVLFSIFIKYAFAIDWLLRILIAISFAYVLLIILLSVILRKKTIRVVLYLEPKESSEKEYTRHNIIALLISTLAIVFMLAFNEIFNSYQLILLGIMIMILGFVYFDVCWQSYFSNILTPAKIILYPVLTILCPLVLAELWIYMNYSAISLIYIVLGIALVFCISFLCTKCMKKEVKLFDIM